MIFHLKLLNIECFVVTNLSNKLISSPFGLFMNVVENAVIGDFPRNVERNYMSLTY